MPVDVGLLGKLAMAAILGGGALWWILGKLKQGEINKAKADTLDSYIKGDEAANATEQKISDAIKKVDDENVTPNNFR